MPRSPVGVPARRDVAPSRALLLVLLLALVVRLIGLGAHDFWFDEALELARDRLPWPRILFLARGPDPPLFRVLMSPLARVASSEEILRLPSVAFSVATVWLVWRWIARLGDRRLALVTAALLAVAPVQVHYAQEVSQYALAGMVGAAMLLAMQLVLDRGERRDFVLLGASFVAALLSYYGLVFLIAAVDVVLLLHVVQARDRTRLRRLLAVNALVAVLAALLAWAMLSRQYDEFASQHLAPLLAAHAPHELPAIFGRLLESNVLRFFWLPWSERAPRVLLVLPAVLVLLGVVGLLARGARFTTPLVVALTSFAAMALAHLLGAYPFGFRYALFLSPLLFLLVAEGLCRLARWRAVAIVTGLAVAASQVAFLPNLPLGNPWVAPPHENLGRVLDWVAACDDDAPVYVFYGALPAFGLYRKRIEQPVLRGRNVRALAAEGKVAEVLRVVGGRARFYLVASHLWRDEQDVLLAGLQAPSSGLRLVGATLQRGAFGALFERADPP